MSSIRKKELPLVYNGWSVVVELPVPFRTSCRPKELLSLKNNHLKEIAKMSAKGLQTTLLRVSAFLFLISMVVTAVIGAQDHDVPVSVDGMRCDSCGSECSSMCGSRNFRACCYNYIKKRSVPWANTGLTNGAASENADGEKQVEGKSTSSIAGTNLKSITDPATPNQDPSSHHSMGMGRHFFRRNVPGIVGGDSMEEGAFIYPMSLRDVMTSMIRTMNAFENRKFGRMMF